MTQAFQAVLDTASGITKAAVLDFHEKWKKQKSHSMIEIDPSEMYNVKQLHNWETFYRQILKVCVCVCGYVLYVCL